MYKTLTAFLNLLINLFFFFTYLKIHQLKIFKITKKDYKTQLAKDIKVFLKKRKKQVDNVVVGDAKFYH